MEWSSASKVVVDIILIVAGIYCVFEPCVLCMTTLLVVFGQVGLTARGLKSRLVFARAVCWPGLICHRHGLVAGQDCWILLDWCGVWPKLLHWSGFCWRCLSPCWTARASYSHIGDNCKWSSIPRVRGELTEDKRYKFWAAGRICYSDCEDSGSGRHGSRGVCLP